MHDGRIAARGGLDWLILAGVAAMCVGVGGCASGPKREPTFPVRGAVTFEGKPVARATVSFRPRGAGRPANGITNADGVYELTTYSHHDGAIPGQYAVTVTKFEAPPAESSAAGDEYAPPSGPLPEPKNMLPARFADFAKSALKAEVTKDPAANTFDFALTP